MTDIRIYPKATILLFESGEYSDFGYCGQVVTLCDLDLHAEFEAWKVALGRDGDGEWVVYDYYHGPNEFVSHLIVTQKCAPLDCQTVHIGNYGRVEL